MDTFFAAITCQAGDYKASSRFLGMGSGTITAISRAISDGVLTVAVHLLNRPVGPTTGKCKLGRLNRWKVHCVLGLVFERQLAIAADIADRSRSTTFPIYFKF